MKSIFAFLFIFLPPIVALPNLGNKTEEYRDCIRNCNYVYNPEYLAHGAALTRLVELFQAGVIPDHEYIEERTRLERSLESTMPVMRSRK